MTARTKIILILGLVVIVVAAGVAGMMALSGRPQEALQDAETAISAALSAQAETYAPELLEKAQSDFAAAAAELDRQDDRSRLFRSYRRAKQLLQSAKEAALEARAIGADRGKQARSARASIDLAKIEVENARKSLEWAADLLGRDEIRSMGETLEKLQIDLRDAGELFDQGDFVRAKSVAATVLRETTEIEGRIRKAT